MMTAKLHHRISRLMQRTITNFCRERISFDHKLHVVGLVALNIDDEDVDVLVKMDKTFTKENDDLCDGEDDDEEDVETMEFDRDCKSLEGYSPVVLVDSSTSATANVSQGVEAEQEYEEDDISPCEVSSPMETREEADTNYCSLEDDEVVPLPPPLSSVIEGLHEEGDEVDDDLERVQVCTSTSIVTPLFHHKQKRKRFRPMRLYQPVNGLVLSSSNSLTGGSHSSEEPPSPNPYLPPPPVSATDFTLLPELVGGSPTDSLSDHKTSMDLPLPPLPSSDTASGEEDDEETRAIVLNGIDSSTAERDLIPLSPVPGDVLEDERGQEEDEELQITAEFCRQPQPSILPIMSSLPPPPPPPPPLTAVTLPLLSLPLAGTSSALNSIPLIPLRQVSSQNTPRQFALITGPGTGILLPSNLQQQQPQQQSTTILATAVTKSLTVSASVPSINSSASLSTVNSIISSFAAASSGSSTTPAKSTPTTTSTTSSTTTTSPCNSTSTSSSTSSSKSKTLSILSNGSGSRSRRNALKFHHSPITIPAAAASLRPLPTMTSSGSSVASSLMRHYNCRYCGKMFNRKFCLERHERLHTGVKPYACSCCGERFIRLEDKKRHVRTVHEPVPPGSSGLGEKTAMECSVSAPNSGGSSSAHMLSIISAVAAAAAVGKGKR